MEALLMGRQSCHFSTVRNAYNLYDSKDREQEISAPAFFKSLPAAELYTDPKMEIWRGFQEATHPNKSGNAAPISRWGSVI